MYRAPRPHSANSRDTTSLGYILSDIAQRRAQSVRRKWARETKGERLKPQYLLAHWSPARPEDEDSAVWSVYTLTTRYQAGGGV
jgi:hypothetical protein